jgi:hypothetical protein
VLSLAGTKVPLDIGEILVHESVAESPAGIGEQKLDLPAANRIVKGVDAFQCCQVSLDGYYLNRLPAQLFGRIFDLGLVGGDQKVKALSRATFCQGKPMPDDSPVMIASDPGLLMSHLFCRIEFQS